MKRGFLLLPCLLISLLALFSCVLPLGGDGNREDGKTDDESDVAEGGGENEERDEYTVTFDACDGSKPTTKVVKAGSTLYVPYYVPAKPNYLFVSWCYGDREWKFGVDKVTSDITLTARFKTIDYRITYELNGGSCSSSLPDMYNIESESFTLPTPTKDGSFFDGWYLDGEPITEIANTMRRDLALTAKFYDSVPEIIEAPETASTAKALAINGEKSVIVELNTEDGKQTDFLLRVKVPEEWLILSVTQGSATRYAQTEEIDGGTYATVKISSDGYVASLAPITYKGDITLESNFGITLPSGNVVDVNYFPGFVRKTVTFTLDDGLINFDERVINILKPAGIKGTFNLCNTNATSKEEYLKLYEGFEIANHHVLHAVAMKDSYAAIERVDEYLPSDADKSKVYLKSQVVDGEQVEGLYYVSIGGSWHPMASDETYIKYLEWTTEKLEEVFGEGSIAGFAYPHGNQYNDAIIAYLKDAGYLYGRRTGNLKDSTGFALPADRYTWTYNADHNCLLEVMEKFDKYADDGELKMFSFGVHAKDFETYSKWEDLETFAELYGGRPEDFWYATNREIFEYEDAIKALIISDEGITNDSSVDVFVSVNGIKTLIPAGTEYVFDN